MYILSLNCYLFAPHVLTASKLIRHRADDRVASHFPRADIRMDRIIDYVISNDADVVCFQEGMGSA